MLKADSGDSNAHTFSAVPKLTNPSGFESRAYGLERILPNLSLTDGPLATPEPRAERVDAVDMVYVARELSVTTVVLDVVRDILSLYEENLPI